MTNIDNIEIEEVAEIFPPGEFLKDEIEARGWTQSTLAEIMGRPVKAINDIILGKRAITARTANELSHALGTSAELWLRLENDYRLSRARTPATAVARRAKIYSKYPVKEMVQRGWLERTKDIDVLEQRVLKFFAIQSPDEVPIFSAHAARKSTSYEEVTPKQLAWMFRSRQLASAISVQRFSDESLGVAIERLRALLLSAESVRMVPRILADAGIGFLVVQPIPGTGIDGLTFWLNDDERFPVIAVSLRHGRIDGFWHTLWHELWHVKKRDGLRSPAVLDTNLVGKGAQPFKDKPPGEQAADLFACECSIPHAELENFIARVHPLYSKQRIRGFAQRLQVHPGIVVGQLQYRGKVDWSHDREMLEKVRDIVTDAALTDGWDHSLPADFTNQPL